MFAYTDPTGGSLLEREDALEEWRSIVHAFYRKFARLPRSAFTLLDAFEGVDADRTTVTWIAFPRTATASFEDIDESRFDFQDEYVEWRTEQDGDRVTRVTFTTEFPEYYEALALKGAEALIDGIRDAIPGADPTKEELFGDFDPDSASPDARASTFVQGLRENPWNNGEKGILCLRQRFNTMHALFNLLGHCGVPRDDIAPSAVCSNVGGACGPNRNSDPRICQAAQETAKQKKGLSLEDPVGIRLLKLEGIWKIDGTQVDINASDRWTVSRNGRRAVLDCRGVTIGDDPVTSGTQVSTKLQVGATVLTAPESALPAWAKMGQESSRNIV